MRLPFQEHQFPGILIAVEGTSRSGKSTFITQHVVDCKEGEVVIVTWNSFPPVHTLINHLKAEALLDKWSFCLAHLLDYELTYQQIICPALSQGKVVITDRYFYTSWVRDTIRGVSPGFLLEFYKEFIRPDYTFYFETSTETALERFRLTRWKFGRYGLGLDLGESLSPEEAFLNYHQRQVTEYRKLAAANDFIVQAQDSIMEQVLSRHSTHPNR